MEITRVSQPVQLRSLADSWNLLNHGMPLCSWQWLHTWWDHYATARELYVLSIREPGGQIVGIAPWYLEESSGLRTIRFLGSGQVCTDHLTVLATPEHETGVLSAIADWLSSAEDRIADRWDQIELECVPSDDRRIRDLATRLTAVGCSVRRRADAALWQLDLPDSWSEYTRQFSKSRRKRLRKYERIERNENLKLHTIQHRAELDHGLQTLIGLHLKRRDSLGETSCFRSPIFVRFLTGVAPLLLDSGTLQLSVLQAGGRPIAADFSLITDETIYLFQGGFDPAADKLSPGHLITAMLIRQSVAAGRRRFDFLRGDETYKEKWGAHHRKTIQIRIAANRFVPRIRQDLYQAGLSVKGLIKNTLNLAHRIN